MPAVKSTGLQQHHTHSERLAQSKDCWTAIKQTPNLLSQVRTWLRSFGVCLIAAQNDDPGPWVFINLIARPIIGLAQRNYTVLLQPRHSAIG
jgi:hypothetical protein